MGIAMAGLHAVCVENDAKQVVHLVNNIRGATEEECKLLQNAYLSGVLLNLAANQFANLVPTDLLLNCHKEFVEECPALATRRLQTVRGIVFEAIEAMRAMAPENRFGFVPDGAFPFFFSRTCIFFLENHGSPIFFFAGTKSGSSANPSQVDYSLLLEQSETADRAKVTVYCFCLLSHILYLAGSRQCETEGEETCCSRPPPRALGRREETRRAASDRGNAWGGIGCKEESCLDVDARRRRRL
jgi:hypothetical protein